MFLNLHYQTPHNGTFSDIPFSVALYLIVVRPLNTQHCFVVYVSAGCEKREIPEVFSKCARQR